MKIFCIGDLHLKENLGYAEYVSDRRIAERENVLDKIVEASVDSDMVVLMGDQLNGRSNHAETLKRFVAFLERLGDKPIRILVGNHERFSSGASSLDFLKELKGKDWKIISQVESEIFAGYKFVYLPYFTGPEIMDSEHKDWVSASQKLMNMLPDGDILFTHHAISGTFSAGILTDKFEEILLQQDVLLKKYRQVVAGHIHSKSIYADGRILLTGSIFTDCVGEGSKSVWKVRWDTIGFQESVLLQEIKLPVRPIFKLENPTAETVDALPRNAIVKVIVTDYGYDVDAVKKQLDSFDGSVVVEQVVKERDKEVELEGGELTVENLLRVYAKQRGIDPILLFEGYALIQ